MPTIQRQTRKQALSITTAIGTTGEINYTDAAGGTLHITAGSGLTTLTFWVAPEIGGTFTPAYESTTAVTLTVVHTRAYAIPASLLGAGAIKIVGNTTGSIEVSLKS